jgi:hypothetical protein
MASPVGASSGISIGGFTSQLDRISVESITIMSNAEHIFFITQPQKI